MCSLIVIQLIYNVDSSFSKVIELYDLWFYILKIVFPYRGRYVDKTATCFCHMT